jgi:hypothetical protein
MQVLLFLYAFIQSGNVVIHSKISRRPTTAPFADSMDGGGMGDDHDFDSVTRTLAVST